LLTIVINSSKNSKKKDKKLLKKTNTLVVYINKNKINKKIKIIVVLLHKIINTYLELNTIFIVYSTKLYKIILILILTHIFEYNKIYIIIYINN